ncbi:hypothetical protein AAIR29_06810 [Psychrobacter sp. FBL11]|uniref:Lipoprotein n=1 Tax=Psychrobacter saeujeotis TaxID=3143436 RepID=A0ABU9X809_9GAMM|nr:hypothetical protein [uncultured Psychrobacter sp.]
MEKKQLAKKMIHIGLKLEDNMKKLFKLTISIILLESLLSCSQPYKAEGTEVIVEELDEAEVQYGVIGINNDCFVTDSKLKNKQTVYLTETSVDPMVEEVATIDAIKVCDTYDVRDFDYKYSFTNPIKVNPQSAFVLLEPESAKKISLTSSFDLDKDSITDEVRICYEHESYIFGIWSGDPIKDRNLISVEIFTHFDLDPDAEPKCTKVDRKYLETK